MAVVANPDLRGTQRWRTISTVAPNHSLEGGKSCADQREATPLSPDSWDISIPLLPTAWPNHERETPEPRSENTLGSLSRGGEPPVLCHTPAGDESFVRVTRAQDGGKTRLLARKVVNLNGITSRTKSPNRGEKEREPRQ